MEPLKKIKVQEQHKEVLRFLLAMVLISVVSLGLVYVLELYKN